MFCQINVLVVIDLHEIMSWMAECEKESSFLAMYLFVIGKI